jgi:hypothetical protein
MRVMALSSNVHRKHVMYNKQHARVPCVEIFGRRAFIEDKS